MDKLYSDSCINHKLYRTLACKYVIIIIIIIIIIIMPNSQVVKAREYNYM